MFRGCAPRALLAQRAARPWNRMQRTVSFSTTARLPQAIPATTEQDVEGTAMRFPLSLQAIYYKPLHRPPTHGLPVCNLHLRSYSVRNLEFQCDFALRAAYYLNLPASGIVALPKRTERWTVPRSNFVHKKSQENYERVTYKRLIQIKDGHSDTVELWLAFLKKHAVYGVAMKAHVWAFEEIGVGKKMGVDLGNLHDPRRPKWEHFGLRKTSGTAAKVRELLESEAFQRRADIPPTPEPGPIDPQMKQRVDRIRTDVETPPLHGEPHMPRLERLGQNATKEEIRFREIELQVAQKNAEQNFQAAAAAAPAPAPMPEVVQQAPPQAPPPAYVAAEAPIPDVPPQGPPPSPPPAYVAAEAPIPDVPPQGPPPPPPPAYVAAEAPIPDVFPTQPQAPPPPPPPAPPPAPPAQDFAAAERKAQVLDEIELLKRREQERILEAVRLAEQKAAEERKATMEFQAALLAQLAEMQRELQAVKAREAERTRLEEEKKEEERRKAEERRIAKEKEILVKAWPSTAAPPAAAQRVKMSKTDAVESDRVHEKTSVKNVQPEEVVKETKPEVAEAAPEVQEAQRPVEMTKGTKAEPAAEPQPTAAPDPSLHPVPKPVTVSESEPSSPVQGLPKQLNDRREAENASSEAPVESPSPANTVESVLEPIGTIEAQSDDVENAPAPEMPVPADAAAKSEPVPPSESKEKQVNTEKPKKPKEEKEPSQKVVEKSEEQPIPQPKAEAPELPRKPELIKDEEMVPEKVEKPEEVKDEDKSS